MENFPPSSFLAVSPLNPRTSPEASHPRSTSPRSAMVRFLQQARRALRLSPSLRSPSSPVSFPATPPTLPSFSPSCPSLYPARSYISEMRRSAFQENLLRILRTEIDYEVDVRPPQEVTGPIRLRDGPLRCSISLFPLSKIFFLFLLRLSVGRFSDQICLASNQ